MANIINLSNRRPVWDDIGIDVSASSNVSEAMVKAGLDFTVRKSPLTTDSGIILPNHVANVRDDTGEVMGVTAPKYEIIQNSDAFDFADYINHDLTFEKAGMTKSGMMYLIGKLPSHYIMDDEYNPYVILRNSFNGRFPIQAAICPLRIVCQNQFAMAFKKSDNTVRIKHSSLAKGKMEEAQEVLRRTAEHMNTMNDFAQKLYGEKVDELSFNRLVNAMFETKETDSKRAKTTKEEERVSFLTAYNADDNANFRGTKWGLLNAFSDFQTHKPIQRMTETANENRFEAVSFDPKAITNFMNLVNSKVS